MADPDPRDPKYQAKQYLEKNQIPELLETITAQLLFQQPRDPRAFIVQYLEKVKLTGTPALYTQADLETMFCMFDVTNRGVITADQANAGLRSILGPTASLGVPAEKFFKKTEFVTDMTKALAEASPYRKAL